MKYKGKNKILGNDNGEDINFIENQERVKKKKIVWKSLENFFLCISFHMCVE